MIATLVFTWHFSLHDARAHRLRDGRQFPGRPPDRPAGADDDVFVYVYCRADCAAGRAGDSPRRAGRSISGPSRTEPCCSNRSWWWCLAASRCEAGAAACATSWSGAALIAVLRNGMTLYDFTTQIQDVSRGLVLIAAIFVDNISTPETPKPTRSVISEN